MRRIPLVYIFHSPWHQEYLFRRGKHRPGRRFFSAMIRQAIERLCVSNADKVVTLSQYMREKLYAVHGLQPEKSVVIPGGVDLQRFTPPKDRLRAKQEVGFPAGVIHLLTVRNLEPRMGLDNLLESLRMIPAGSPAVHLTIVGEGPQRDILRKMISEKRLEKRVTMTGTVSTAALIKHYGAADFFVLPTRDLEGFGLVTPESMACGTPVVGTPVGGTKEILSKFEPGFLFADNSPRAIAAGIERMARQYDLNDDAYRQLRKRCREFVEENYAWDRHVRELVSVLMSARYRSGYSGELRGK